MVMSMHDFQEKRDSRPIAVLLAALAAGAAVPVSASGAELAPFMYDSSTEITAGRAVAKSACARCHGMDGVGKLDTVPHLAGQRPVFLFDRLLAHQAGKTSSAAMHKAVRFLSETALRQAAAYYSSLDPPRITGEPPVFVDPVQVGREAAAACAGCHGENGNSEIPGTPRLSGLHPGYLAAAIKAYRDGGRQHEVMAPMAGGIADADIDNIALHYGYQKPLRTSVKAVGDAAAGAKLATACGGCHGATGNSAKADIPSLAGQDPQYLADAIKAYQSGNRKSPAMESPVAELKDVDVANVAAFFAAQEPLAAALPKQLSVGEWAARCDRCHGLAGNSTQVDVPALAGQRANYLAKSLIAFRAGVRKSVLMDAMTSVLSDLDIKNLAAYYAHNQPKGVVFVRVLPSK